MRINLVDLVKSFQKSILYLLANVGVDTGENGPQSLPKISQKLYKKLEKHRSIATGAAGNRGAFAQQAAVVAHSTALVLGWWPPKLDLTPS